MPGFDTSSSPTTEPGPSTKLKTPAGRSASATQPASSPEQTAVIEAGVQTTVFPAASAGATNTLRPVGLMRSPITQNGWS